MLLKKQHEHGRNPRPLGRGGCQHAANTYSTHTNPKTFKFFKAHKSFLESRSTFKTRMKSAPFFAIYNVGDYSFAPYKVIWAEMTGDFAAAVVGTGTVPGYGKRVYVADHKLYFADFTEPEPAYFLYGLLHSEIVKEMIEAHNVSTNMGDIFKHVSLPRFDAKDTDHIKLAELVKQAHGQHDGAIRAKTVVNVRLAAAKLIGREIQWRKK